MYIHARMVMATATVWRWSLWWRWIHHSLHQGASNVCMKIIGTFHGIIRFDLCVWPFTIKYHTIHTVCWMTTKLCTNGKAYKLSIKHILRVQRKTNAFRSFSICAWVLMLVEKCWTFYWQCCNHKYRNRWFKSKFHKTQIIPSKSLAGLKLISLDKCLKNFYG